jgi:hypothetical protein
MNHTSPFIGRSARGASRSSSRARKAWIAAMGALAIGCALPGVAQAAWNYEDVASGVGTNWGTASVLWNNAPHTFFYGYTGNITHAYQSGGAWTTGVIDGTANSPPQVGDNVGAYPSAAVLNNQIHLFYWDQTVGDLRHAVGAGQYLDGGPWSLESLDGPGYATTSGKAYITSAGVGWTSSAIVWNGELYVAYREYTNGNLRMGHYSPAWNFWSLKTIDGITGGGTGAIAADVGEHPSFVIDGTTLRVYYYDRTNGALREAWTTDGETWTSSTLDGIGGTSGRTTNDVGFFSSAVEFNGQPNVFYWDATTNTLRRGVRAASGAWSFSTLDGQSGANGRITAHVGRWVSAVIHQSVPHFYYQDSTNGNMRAGNWNGTDFSFQTLDGNGGNAGALNVPASYAVGADNSAFTINDNPHVFYTYTDGQGVSRLRHAFWQ